MPKRKNGRCCGISRVSLWYLPDNSLMSPSETRKIPGVCPAEPRQKNGVARPLDHQRV